MKWARKVVAFSTRPSGQSREACQGTGLTCEKCLVSTVTVSGSSGSRRWATGSEDGGGSASRGHSVGSVTSAGDRGLLHPEDTTATTPHPRHTCTVGLAQLCVLQAEGSLGRRLAWPMRPWASWPLPHSAPSLSSPASQSSFQFAQHSPLPPAPGPLHRPRRAPHLCKPHLLALTDPRPPSSDSISTQRALISLPACISRLPPRRRNH